MGILGLFKSRDRPRNHTGDSVGGGRFFSFGGTWAGKSVTERTAMQTTAVYACVRIIAETVASLPLHVYEYTDNGKERVYTHPLYRILHDIPNPEMNSFILREVMMSHLLLWGNSYSQIIRNGKGEIMALYPLLPDKMSIDRGADNQLYYTYSSDKQGSFIFRKDEILHIVGLGFDGLIGHSPIAMAKNAIGLTIAAEECPLCNKTYYGRSALSRTDNETVICPLCGYRQALNSIGVESDEAEKIVKMIEQNEKEHSK